MADCPDLATGVSPGARVPHVTHLDNVRKMKERHVAFYSRHLEEGYMATQVKDSLAVRKDQRARTLQEVLDELSRPGELYRRVNDAIECYACGHRCRMHAGQRGICQVRYNRDGTLYVPWGYVAALQVDPTEKKPFFHVLPGSYTLTFGMLGCDLRCSYCQNWLTSQALRDPAAGILPQRITPEEMVRLGLRYNARCVASSYNEPLITSEWAVAVFQVARKHGLKTLYVSNGNATPEVLSYLRPWLDGYKVDLKTMNPKHYKLLGGKLESVLETIRAAHEMGFWVEVVTLIVPQWNDSEAELREAARFIASVSPDIPWHVTAFHPDYKMTDRARTQAQVLIRAADIGREEGLHFVYAGNLPGQVGPYENTYCPQCHALLIERWGFHVRQNRLTPEGRCPQCQAVIPGIWQ